MVDYVAEIAEVCPGCEVMAQDGGVLVTRGLNTLFIKPISFDEGNYREIAESSYPYLLAPPLGSIWTGASREPL